MKTSHPTVVRTRRQLVEEGLDAALSRKKSSWSPPRTFDGEAEAKLIALACSEPPPGHARWTLKVAEQKVVELGIVEAASDTTIYRTLKKRELHAKVRKWRSELGKCRAGSGYEWICRQDRHGILHHQRTFVYNHWESRSKHIGCALSNVIPEKNEVKPHKCRYWVIPPKASAAFVSAMEKVLEVYARLNDPARPLVCLDETSKQLIRETRIPLPVNRHSKEPRFQHSIGSHCGREGQMGRSRRRASPRAGPAAAPPHLSREIFRVVGGDIENAPEQLGDIVRSVASPADNDAPLPV